MDKAIISVRYLGEKAPVFYRYLRRITEESDSPTAEDVINRILSFLEIRKKNDVGYDVDVIDRKEHGTLAIILTQQGYDPSRAEDENMVDSGQNIETILAKDYQIPKGLIQNN
jgi:hypothetical protein